MHIFRVYFSKLAARNPIWRFLIGLLHSSIFIFLIAVLASQKILQDDIAVPLIIFFPIFVILTYTFFLRRFFNPEDLDKFLKSKEEKRKEREQRKKEREAEAERYKRELIKEEEKEKKRIKDNYLDIGLGHKLPKTLQKIRRKITDKSVIRIENYLIPQFNEYYLKKYMPNLLYEIRKEVINGLIEHKILYPNWKRFIEKKYDPSILSRDGGIRLGTRVFNPEGDLVEQIIFDKLIDYFLKNGWTLSEDRYRKKESKIVPIPRTAIVNKEIFYLHPPEK